MTTTGVLTDLSRYSWDTDVPYRNCERLENYMDEKTDWFDKERNYKWWKKDRY
jgi:hypothetical protein